MLLCREQPSFFENYSEHGSQISRFAKKEATREGASPHPHDWDFRSHAAFPGPRAYPDRLSENRTGVKLRGRPHSIPFPALAKNFWPVVPFELPP
jgi:hypothetical protein